MPRSFLEGKYNHPIYIYIDILHLLVLRTCRYAAGKSYPEAFDLVAIF